MPASFLQQFRTVFRKNIMIHLRSRAIVKELFNLAIVIAVVIVLDKAGNQSNSQQSIPFYMGIAIMLFCRGVALSWVNQRQSRQAEVQKIMGVTNSAYYAGWMLYYTLNGLFISLVFMGALSAAGLFKDSSVGFGQVLGLYFLYLVASFSFVLFLTCFFSDSLLASQIITFIQLMSSMLYFLLYISNFRSSRLAMQATAILPPVAFEYTIMAMGVASDQSLFSTPFTTTQGFITLGILAVIYYVLFLYLSQVLPNEFGSQKHPLFFLQCFCRRTGPQSQLEQSFELANLSSARYYEETKEQKKISMSLKGLAKSFDNKVIVNGLSMSLFQGQIFCLLGHNGAGKSTTINMLTGILQPDDGAISICGFDYYTQMDQIRSRTGVCLQIDVLYDDLTVQEHIRYYANIKGIPPSNIEAVIDEMVIKCGLQDERTKLTKELSGGNKRKTCLACASIGDSQLLFLDEPSSGLDPSSRRVIWGLIESLKREGRTVILTTHHLEEAQVLANRIGILSHGEMLVQGSVHYIRQRFGCGYYLEIALNASGSLEKQREVLRAKVKELIGGFREDEQVNEHSMRFLLPSKQQQHYATLFAFLQGQEVKFSLRLSSLEDIFIKIGMDAEGLLNDEPLPELQKVAVPDYEPVYSMSTQIKYIFRKKFRTTIRSPSLFFSILLPVIFIVMGIVISMEAFEPSPDPKTNVVITWSKYYTIVYFMSLAFAFNTASYCGSIVKEREIKFKYLSYVMGMKKPAYWLGTIAFDLIMFCLPFTVIFLVIGCFPSDQNSDLVHGFGWLALTLILFALCFLPFTYLWSFAFDNSRSAYRFYPFLVFLLFYVVPSIPIYIVPNSEAIKYILPLISPLMGLTQCFMSRQMLGSNIYYIIQDQGQLYDVQFFIVKDIWYPLVIFAVQAVIFFLVVLVLDNLKFDLKDRQEITRDEAELHQSDDLRRQKQKIKELNETKPIVVDGLYKKYPNGYVAVRDNSFIVEKGETFGLLGPNGAGKSTTFNILTAAIPKTQGRVTLHGSEVNRAVDEIFTTVGVCPQFNPLYDQLTTAQHLQFFAGIKGLDGQQKDDIIDFYMTHLQLAEYRDVRSGKLSGGNKRKLCVAMSLVGNPSLIFLDEPSAGVDPIARRYLWNILHSSSSLKTRSIVLTTHSINEAESLCDKIGILIQGQFYCIDSPRELKTRYGKGYRATLQCASSDQLEAVKKTVRDTFGDSFTEETFQEERKVCFEFGKEGFVFSKAFGLFYNTFVKEGLVVGFELSQTTLEEVFIYLSKLQGEHDLAAGDEQSSHFCCWEKNSSGCFCIC